MARLCDRLKFHIAVYKDTADEKLSMSDGECPLFLPDLITCLCLSPGMNHYYHTIKCLTQ